MEAFGRFLVTNGETQVDTEALFAAAARLEALACDLEELEYRARRAGEDTLAASSGDFTGAWQARAAAESAEQGILTARARLIELVDSVRFAANLYCEAEARALSLSEPLTDGELALRGIAGMSMLFPGPAGASGVLLSLLLSSRGPRSSGIDLNHHQATSSYFDWLARLVATGSNARIVAEIMEFTSGAGDGFAGVRLQRDLAAISRALMDTPFCEEDAGGLRGTKEAAVRVAWLSSFLGASVFGAPKGVEVRSGQGLPPGRDHVLVNPGGGVSRGFAKAGETNLRVIDLLSSASLVPGGTRSLTRFVGHRLPLPGTGLPTPTPASSVPTPKEPTALLDHLASLDGSSDSGQFMILRHETPLGDGTSSRSWSVVVRGTQKWGVGASNPQDMLTNFQGVGGLDTDQKRAVLAAMEMAGIDKGEPVEFVGHSQGGIVAADLATDQALCQDYSVVSALTAGSPIAGSVPEGSVRVLALENTRDIVPGLDGANNAPGVVTVHFDGEPYIPEGKEGGKVVAHDIGLYRNALADLQAHEGEELAEVRAWEEERNSRMGFSSRTRTTAFVFDTQRVGY